MTPLQNKADLAVRIHPRLVYIHPFPNGNGRHARLFTFLVQKLLLKTSPFSWGASALTTKSSIRKTYIDALQKADKGDFTALLLFARS